MHLWIIIVRDLLLLLLFMRVDWHVLLPWTVSRNFRHSPFSEKLGGYAMGEWNGVAKIYARLVPMMCPILHSDMEKKVRPNSTSDYIKSHGVSRT